MSLLSVADAADRLGVSVSRIHRLIAEEVVPAQKVGGQWLIDSRDIHRADRHSAGRPLSARSLWALLLAADSIERRDDRDPVAAPSIPEAAFGALSPADKSKARRRLYDLADLVRSHESESRHDPEQAAERVASDLRQTFRNRADRIRLAASPRDLPDLRADGRLRLSGVSLPESGIASADVVEAYVARERLEDVYADYLLAERRHEPNVILHVVDSPDPWNSPHGDLLAWMPAPELRLLLAADLAEHQSPREVGRASHLAVDALGHIERTAERRGPKPSRRAS